MLKLSPLIRFPLPKSHNQSPVELADASVFPSGEKATEVTGLEWPVNIRTVEPRWMSQSRQVLSWDPVTK
jgi:hypothetical protein